MRARSGSDPGSPEGREAAARASPCPLPTQSFADAGSPPSALAASAPPPPFASLDEMIKQQCGEESHVGTLVSGASRAAASLWGAMTRAVEHQGRTNERTDRALWTLASLQAGLANRVTALSDHVGEVDAELAETRRLAVRAVEICAQRLAKAKEDHGEQVDMLQRKLEEARSEAARETALVRQQLEQVRRQSSKDDAAWRPRVDLALDVVALLGARWLASFTGAARLLVYIVRLVAPRRLATVLAHIARVALVCSLAAEGRRRLRLAGLNGGQGGRVALHMAVKLLDQVRSSG